MRPPATRTFCFCAPAAAVDFEGRSALQFADHFADVDLGLDAECDMDMSVCAADGVEVDAGERVGLLTDQGVGGLLKFAVEDGQVALYMPVEMEADLVVDVARHLALLKFGVC